MVKIWKYELAFKGEDGTAFLDLPLRAQILELGVQDRLIYAWALVEGGREAEVRKFRVFGTGAEGVSGKYVGTVHKAGFVWHVFEV